MKTATEPRDQPEDYDPEEREARQLRRDLARECRRRSILEMREDDESN